MIMKEKLCAIYTFVMALHSFSFIIILPSKRNNEAFGLVLSYQFLTRHSGIDSRDALLKLKVKHGKNQLDLNLH